MNTGRTYAETAPPAPLAEDVRCVWWSSFGGSRPILPDGCLDLVVIPEGDGSTTPAVFVAGPDTHAVYADTPSGALVHGIRFRPGRAHRVLGLPADELRDQRVDLADLWGADGRRTADRVREDPGQLAAVVAERLSAARYDPDPYVDEAVRRMSDRRAALSRVTGARTDLPVSERHFRRSFTAAVGYGPATFLRVSRLQWARHVALAQPGIGLADLALRAGYADQAHMSREVRNLTGMTARALFR